MTALPSTAHDARLIPTQPAERIAALDVLRGFALLGILIINLPGFHTPWWLIAAGDELFPRWYDRAASWLVDFLGSGKFNGIFSFLFGVGFAIQLERAAARGSSFVGPYLRRLAALFVMGIAHGLLIWNGDVLHIYAVLGVPLLLLRRAGDRWLLALAIVLMLAPIGRGAVKYVRQEPDRRTAADHRRDGEEQVRIYGHGTYAQAVGLRWREARRDYLEDEGGWFWAILGTTMLLGFIAGRRRIFRDLPAYRPAIRRLTRWSGGVGLALGVAFATCSLLADHASRTPTPLGMLGGLFYILDRPALSLFYIAGIVLLVERPAWRGSLAPLAAVGRMPLTNYLMQSVIASFLFYGYGLGYYGRVGPARSLAVAAAIYAVQVAYSNLWMARFQYGPMEWLWRAITYGRAPAMLAPRHEPEPESSSA